MLFGWDERKSESNVEKHGISFAEAMSLWDDPDMIAVESPRHGERRKIGLARWCGSCWTVVFVQEDERVRIISVRRATPKEAAAYDKARG